jgi:hypothetical protein
MKYFIPASLALVLVLILLMYGPSSSIQCPASKSKNQPKEITGLPLTS